MKTKILMLTFLIGICIIATSCSLKAQIMLVQIISPVGIVFQLIVYSLNFFINIKFLVSVYFDLFSSNDFCIKPLAF